MSTTDAVDENPTRAARPCHACGALDAKRAFEKGGRTFWRCARCRAVRQWPLPTQAELAAYYDASYRDGMYREFADARAMKDATAAYRLGLVSPRVRPGRWLDVGCADGRFVAAARGRGIDAEGVDLSDVAVELAQRDGLPVRCAMLEDLADSSPAAYDTVTAFDVVEHVVDPGAFLDAAHRVLAPDGTLALSVPDLDSLAARLMGRRWSLFIPEEHLHYVGRQSVRTLLERHGFATVAVRPIGKPLTFDYALTQLREYNPALHRVAAAPGRLLPRSLRRRAVTLRIGELLAVARRV